MKQLNSDSLLDMLPSLSRPFHAKYYAMYSSVFDAIVTDPVLMLVPIDDHMVHRGDGVFETFKCVDGSIYNMKAHLDRMKQSAAAFEFSMPWSDEDMEEIVLETVRAGEHRDCLIRILLSRGCGSFGVNPYDCPKPELYVTASELKRPFMELHPEGASLKTSTIATKPSIFARAKNCNYLPNALMKKEAVESGVDFVAVFDDDGHLAEGATENVGLVTRDGRLLFPGLHNILCGTTMMRVLDLAGGLVQSGELKEAGHADIGRDDLLSAAEILIVGTTPNVLAVREFDGEPVGGGQPGPIYSRLNEMLVADIGRNSALQTKVW